MAQNKVAYIDVSKVQVIDRQRSDYGDTEMAELRNSIKEHGLLHAIAVCEYQGGYRLIGGGRRLQAFIDLGYKQIPATIFPELAEEDLQQKELFENITRKDLHWSEVVLARHKIHTLYIKKYGIKRQGQKNAEAWNADKTAKLLGVSPAIISTDLQLAEAMFKMPTLSDLETKNIAIAKLASLSRRVDIKEDSEAILGKISSINHEDYNVQAEAKNRLHSSYILSDFFEYDFGEARFDFAEIDPPYGVDLGEAFKSGTMTTIRNAEDYKEVSKKDYTSFINRLADRIDDLLKEDATFVLWQSSTLNPCYLEQAYKAFSKVGFTVSKIPAIWVKTGAPGTSRNPSSNLGNCYEAFIYGTRGAAKLIKAGANNTFVQPKILAGKMLHPTARPVQLITQIIKTFTPEYSRVLVPFAGSGNTMLAAANANCFSVGFDLSNAYIDQYHVNVDSQPYGAYTSYCHGQT